MNQTLGEQLHAHLEYSNFSKYPYNPNFDTFDCLCPGCLLVHRMLQSGPKAKVTRTVHFVLLTSLKRLN